MAAPITKASSSSSSTQPRRRQSTVHKLPPGDPLGEGELGIGAYFAPLPEHGLMTWEHIQRVVAQDDLDYLIRHPDCETRYIAWGKGIRAHYGGLESYIRQVRLDWKEEDDDETIRKGMKRSGVKDVNEDVDDIDLTSFFTDKVADDTTLVKTIPNDWPYAMPAECGHNVVWCKKPILDEILFAASDTPFPKGPIREAVFEAIHVDGIRGLSGSEKKIPPLGHKTRDCLRKCPEVMTWIKETHKGKETKDKEEEISTLAVRAQTWAGRYIDKYVKKHWPEEDWETAYFCNPPHLRTVPGLSHFHVIVRRKAGNIASN